MRNHQAWLADRPVVIEQNIQIERARAVDDAGRPVAAKLLLDGQQSFEQVLRVEFSL